MSYNRTIIQNTKGNEKRMSERRTKVSYKPPMSYKTIVIWLCGLWALGLGFRMSLELILSDGWIHVPRDAGYGCNIWFDFIPLAVFGFITVWYQTKEMFKVVQRKGWVSTE